MKYFCIALFNLRLNLFEFNFYHTVKKYIWFRHITNVCWLRYRCCLFRQTPLNRLWMSLKLMLVLCLFPSSGDPTSLSLSRNKPGPLKTTRSPSNKKGQVDVWPVKGIRSHCSLAQRHFFVSWHVSHTFSGQISSSAMKCCFIFGLGCIPERAEWSKRKDQSRQCVLSVTPD